MDGKLEEPAGSHYFACVSEAGSRFLETVHSRRVTDFANSHQVINNACASIALLNATLNIRDPNVQLGDELSNLQSFSEGQWRHRLPAIARTRTLTCMLPTGLDPETRGWTLTNSEKLREGQFPCGTKSALARGCCAPVHSTDMQRACSDRGLTSQAPLQCTTRSRGPILSTWKTTGQTTRLRTRTTSSRTCLSATSCTSSTA